MSITRNASIEQLWYTWSTAGYGSTNGFRIRKISAGLDVNSARVKSMDRFLRYTLPPGYDSFSTSPEQAPVSLSLLNTEFERVLIYKTYRGKDLVGRPGNFFAHLLAGLPDTLTARDAIDLWRSDFWQMTDTNDQEVTMRAASGDELARASRAPIDLGKLHEPLASLILAYLTRQPELRIYIIADTSDIVAALIGGLTCTLPEQLLQGLTFSTYEADVTRAPMQIVGTCLRTVSERDARAEQTILAHCRREGLLLDCRHPGNSSPLEWETLAGRFAKFAAESVADNDIDQLNELYKPMQHQAQISVHEFLNEYKHIVEDAQKLSPEQIEFYLNHERYALQKLNDPRIRDAIIDFLIVDPTWWGRSLKSIIVRLKMQSSHFTYPLSRLAKRGVRIAVEKMQTSVSAQDEVVLETMLDLILTLEQPAPASEVWTSFLQQVGASLPALQFLFQYWPYASQLLTIWSNVQVQGSLDEQIRPVLWIQWPNYEQLLQLPIPIPWKAIATDQLLNDATQKPDDRSMVRLGNTGTQQAVEEVLTLLIQTPSSWQTATSLIILLTGQRFPFSKTSEDLIIQHFRQMLEDRQWWNWAMLLRDTLLRTYKTEDVLHLVVRSSIGREHAQEQADSLLQTSQEQATFLEKLGPKLLTYVHPATTSMVITLFGRLAREHYPGKMGLLFILLEKLDDARVGELLNAARLNPDEKASVLKSYSKRYLTSRIVSPVMLEIFDELVHNGYSQKIEVLSTFFQRDLPPATLEELLVHAQLSTVHDYIAFHTHIGTWYITQNPRSPTMVRLLETLASQRYIKKMELVFAWLKAPLDDNLLSYTLQQALLSPEEKVAVLNTYGYAYLSPPRSSRAMLDLCIETLRMQPPDKLALVSMALSSQIDETPISEVLEAANLVLANGGTATQEIKELFEQYGSKFLQFTLQSSVLQRYVEVYLQSFTFDDLMRQPARDLIHTLNRFMYSSASDQLMSWYTIDNYLVQPTSARLQEFLKKVLQHKARMSISEVFRTRIAQMCHTLIGQNTDMAYIIPAVDSVFQGLDKIQLLYAMADCAAQDYSRLHREEMLLPYIYFLPRAREVVLPSIPSKENMEYFIVALLNTLLFTATPETIGNLNGLLSNNPIVEWQIYCERIQTRRPETEIEAVSSSRFGRIKNFFVYAYARRLLQWTLSSRKPRRIARAWNTYQAVLEKNDYKMEEGDLQHIKMAKDFCDAYDRSDENDIVRVCNIMDNTGYFSFTKQEQKNIKDAYNAVKNHNAQAHQQTTGRT